MTEAEAQGSGADAVDRVRPAADVAARRLGDEIVLVNLRTNLIYELNPTGARVWELLTDGCDRSQLEQRMLEEFDVGDEVLRDEIHTLISSLLDAGLVTADEPA